MQKLAPLALSAFLACSGSQQKKDIEQDPITYEDPDDPNKPKDGDAAAAGHLTIVPIKLSDGQALELAITEDGSISASGQKVGSVNVKGEMLHSNGGLLATLNKDGSIKKAHIKEPFLDNLVVDKKGVLVKAGKPLVAISSEGVVSVNGTGMLTLEGPAEGRQAVMFVLAVALAPTLGEAIKKLGEANPDGDGGDGGDDGDDDDDDDDDSGNPCGG